MRFDAKPMEEFSIWAAAQGGEKFNPDILEDLVVQLVRMTTQKTAGQRKEAKRDLSWDNYERVRMGILAEATMLVLQGGLEIIRKAQKTGESEGGNT